MTEKFTAGPHMGLAPGSINILDPETNQIAHPNRVGPVMQQARDNDPDYYDAEALTPLETELLEALEKIVNLDGPNPNLDGYGALLEAIDIAQAAIAKAEGE